MPTLEAIPTPHLRTDVFLVDAPDHTGWLLDLRGSFFALNPSALQLVRAALADDDERLCSLAESGRTTIERVQHDQQMLVAMLVARGLLSTSAVPMTPAPAWANILWRALVGRSPTPNHYGRLLALNWFLFKKLGWQATVQFVQATVRREPLVSPAIPMEALRRAVARSLLWVGCKERSLAAATVAWSMGYSANVVLGVSPFPLASHAWCEVEGHVVTDPPDRVEPFIRVAEYC